VLLTIALTAVGQRIFVDATAAVYYNADQRIPEAVADGWWYAALWGILNGALAGLAYGRGILQSGRGVTRIAAAAVLALDFSFQVVLGIRGAWGDLAVALGVCLVFALLGLLAWRRPVLGGVVLLAVGGVLALSALAGSATYRGEAAGLLFDEDTFFVFSIGVLPVVAGVLSLMSSRYRGR